MKIVLIGPPGAGKGTQGKRLSEMYKLTWLSSGNIFRENIEEKTPVSIRLQALVAQGRLVPDDIVNEIILTRLKNLDRFLLDGYPRNLHQAQSLVKFLADDGKSLDYVIEMVLPEKEVLSRLENRLYCKKCSRVYNAQSVDPNKICPVCNVPLAYRSDDQKDIVRERLKIYHQHIASVLHYFQTLGLLRKVNSSGNIDEVFHNIRQVLGEP